MADIFGYNNSVRSEGQVASSEFASITAGKKQSLVQNVTASYGQTVTPVNQLGDTQIYWITGQPQGSLEITKLVGSSGFFDGWKGLDCGKISNLAVNINGDRCGFSGSGNLTFTGGVIESVSVTLGTQRLTVSENCKIKVASLSA